MLKPFLLAMLFFMPTYVCSMQTALDPAKIKQLIQKNDPYNLAKLFDNTNQLALKHAFTNNYAEYIQLADTQIQTMDTQRQHLNSYYLKQACFSCVMATCSAINAYQVSSDESTGKYARVVISGGFWAITAAHLYYYFSNSEAHLDYTRACSLKELLNLIKNKLDTDQNNKKGQ